ncbi:MAG: hypothetical protein ACHP8A_01270, partial [Terriglobales bacterium]
MSGVLSPVARLAYASDALEPFQWKTDDLAFSFEVISGKLRQQQLVPRDVASLSKSTGVEVALQC